jgi:DNA modification methylase
MSVRILIGDCRDKLRELPDASVNCCVTSPPYFGLRDYGVDGQMGLEPTPDEFVSGMVEVFREVRRVLRDDGTLWLNIGDSYAASGRGGGGGSFQDGDVGTKVSSANSRRKPVAGSALPAGLHERIQEAGGVGRAWVKPPPGLKPKDLIGIPWLLAFALRADGWFLRQDIIWSKPNPMPESVRDRCTKAHEYIFMLSKSSRYYYDNDAVREPYNEASLSRYNTPMQGTDRNGGQIGGARQPGGEWAPKNELIAPNPLGRNKRSVWEVATQPFSEAHFATYPPALIEPCILAGCPKGGTVLDPFGGAGTTGLVADRLQRNAILIELNPEYAEIARKRIASEAGMFGEVLAA